jgi:hypothetical protein
MKEESKNRVERLFDLLYDDLLRAADLQAAKRRSRAAKVKSQGRTAPVSNESSEPDAAEASDIEMENSNDL